MQSSDREVLQAAASWLETGKRVTLFTVAKTWGSSPRPPGSLLARREDGRQVGSVSGGCVEEALAERLEPGTSTPQRLTFGVAADEARRYGLPCGGRLELVAETLTAAAPLWEILRRLDERERVERRLDLTSGSSELHPARREDAFFYDGRHLHKLFGPRWRLLLIGAGHLSQQVAQMALALDYEVIVCDPRQHYQEAWTIPGTQIDTRMPDDAARALADDPRSAVLALTHDPKLDDMALMEALDSDAFYVGALGSRGNNDKRRERLRQLGLSAPQVARLHGPVGLPIGSRTPPEIAVAILAELTALRRGVVMRAADAPAATRLAEA